MSTTAPIFRPLQETDVEASGRLGREAFGFPTSERPFNSPLIPGAHGLGCVIDERLVARAYDREYDSWFGGVLVPTAGIAGVAVAPEARGGGLVRGLLTQMLQSARNRGALLSGLFPSQPGIYRRMGYELITNYEVTAVPIATLAAIPAPPDVIVRRAAPADRAACHEIYTSWASAQNAALSRSGPSFDDTDDAWFGEHQGITVAERDHRIVGYAGWNRGSGVGAGAAIEVGDLFGVDADSHRALLSMIGNFSSIAESVHLDTSGADPLRLLLRQVEWKTVDTDQYMIMIMDVAGLLTAMRYPPGWSVDVGFTISGHLFDDQDGRYRLRVEDGRARCERATSLDRTLDTADGPVFSPQGLSVVVSGAHSCANARRIGLVSGPDGHDSVLDALFGGRQPHIRDHY